MKVFSSDCTFDYSWDEVSTANWRKYCPWNSKSTHVIAVDTLSRSVDPDTGILRTERLITCHQNAPAWMVTLLGASPFSHVHETSYVDPASKRVTMVAQNLTWSNMIRVCERVVYEPHVQQGGEKTRFRQEAKITALCGGWQKIRTKIEEAGVEAFGENARKGKEGFEAVLEMSRSVFGEEKARAARRA